MTQQGGELFPPPRFRMLPGAVLLSPGLLPVQPSALVSWYEAAQAVNANAAPTPVYIDSQGTPIPIPPAPPQFGNAFGEWDLTGSSFIGTKVGAADSNVIQIQNGAKIANLLAVSDALTLESVSSSPCWRNDVSGPGSPAIYGIGRGARVKNSGTAPMIDVPAGQQIVVSVAEGAGIAVGAGQPVVRLGAGSTVLLVTYASLQELDPNWVSGPVGSVVLIATPDGSYPWTGMLPNFPLFFGTIQNGSGFIAGGSGPTAFRPIAPVIGTIYFDTDLGPVGQYIVWDKTLAWSLIGGGGPPAPAQLIPEVVFAPGLPTVGNRKATFDPEVLMAVGALVTNKQNFVLAFDEGAAACVVPASAGVIQTGGMCTFRGNQPGMSVTVKDGAQFEIGGSGIVVDNVVFECEAVTISPFAATGMLAPNFIAQNRGGFRFIAGALVPVLSYSTPLGTVRAIIRDDGLWDRSAVPGGPPILEVVPASTAAATLDLFTGSTDEAASLTDAVTASLEAGVILTVNRDASWSQPTLSGITSTNISQRRADQQQNYKPSAGLGGSQPLQEPAQQFYNNSTRNLEIDVPLYPGDTGAQAIYASGEGETQDRIVSSGPESFDASVDDSFVLTLTAGQITKPEFHGVTVGKAIYVTVVQPPVTPGGWVWNLNGGQTVVPATPATNLDVNPAPSTRTTFVLVGQRNQAVATTIDLQVVANSGNAAATAANIIVWKPGAVSTGPRVSTFAEVVAKAAAFDVLGENYDWWIDTSIAGAVISVSATFSGLAMVRSIPGRPGFPTVVSVLDGAVLDFGKAFSVDWVQFNFFATTTTPIVLDTSGPAAITLTNFARLQFVAGATVPFLSWISASPLSLTCDGGAVVNNQLAPGVDCITLGGGATCNYRVSNTLGIPTVNNTIGGGLTEILVLFRDASCPSLTFAAFTGALAKVRADRLENTLPSTGIAGGQPADLVTGQLYWDGTNKTQQISTDGLTVSDYASGEGSQHFAPVVSGVLSLQCIINNTFEIDFGAPSLIMAIQVLNLKKGKSIQVIFNQDATGSCAVTWNTTGLGLGQLMYEVLPNGKLAPIGLGVGVSTTFHIVGKDDTLFPGTVAGQLIAKIDGSVSPSGGGGVSLGVVEGIFSGMAQQ